MCGIAGAISCGTHAVHGETVRAMAATLSHRGPDDEGQIEAPGFALACRRLAILDLSENGRQPHQNADGSVSSVLNGEIYNHAELRAELARRGHRFRSTSDAELLPALYAEYGDGFPERLRGMFALAVIDQKQSRLVLARDRLGQKPLYYEQRDGQVRFASEPRGLLAASGDVVRPDPAALLRFLSFGYIPSDGSAFSGFHRLRPGELLVADEQGLRRRSYWSLPEEHSAGEDPEVWREELFNDLVAATREQSRADVPVGLLLSGGLDSGLVAAASAASAQSPKCEGTALPAFTMGFDDSQLDERGPAAETARLLGLPWQALELESDPQAAPALIARNFDEPFGDASAVPTLELCRRVREQVKVALTGDGGDELLAGYRRYRALALSDRWDRFCPKPLRRLLRRMLGAAANGTAGRTVFGELRRFCSGLGLDEAQRAIYWSGFFQAPQRRRFLHPDLLDAAVAADPEQAATLEFGRAGSCALRARRFDLRRYLPDDLLVKSDLASMASGLELRAPFLDHRLVERAARLPESLLMRGPRSKFMGRELARGRLPASVVAGGKRGFGVPLAAWFRGPLETTARELLLDGRFEQRRLFRAGAGQELLSRHLSGREDWSAYLWLLLVLEGWFRRFVDREEAAA